MIRRTLKFLGRKLAGTYGRAAKKRQKRLANKASRKMKVGERHE